MLAHEFRMQEMRKEHNEELAELRRRQDEAFAETRLHTATKTEEATKFQTRKPTRIKLKIKKKLARLNLNKLIELMTFIADKTNNLDLYARNRTLSNQFKKNAAVVLTNTLMLKGLIDQQDKKSTQFKLHILSSYEESDVYWPQNTCSEIYGLTKIVLSALFS